ncbi:hypothetical protein ANCDUO_06294 [Ancylostoma duodenale]|uniref:N-acetylgalactosaminide beta-1,3-galactosyltransferase n=1 Tax=Ancylostoma duodenale TaxID=51022 RepID=A0A0C2GPZ0_9BILA|nr:hypothetical protein ANCDUO_06294 [Ancylostoma duodenale]
MSCTISVLFSANVTSSRNALLLETFEHLRRKCRLSCYVVTTSNVVDDRLAAINETWLTRCDHGHFFTNEHSDLSAPPSAIFFSSKSNFTASYKAMLSLRYAFYNLSSKSDWYYVASDDTYVVVENMCQYLATLNPNNPYFIAVAESENHRLPWASQHYKNGYWILQQDRTPAQRAKYTQDWCLANLQYFIRASKWPGQFSESRWRKPGTKYHMPRWRHILRSSGDTTMDKGGAMEYILSRVGLEHLMEEKTTDCSQLSDEGFDFGR